ncbi:GNAT family N-acetyltransferase [Paractinoplanes maris]|uniref:GNAT family N-acetyltransferase n=1 Tax=Paractinoplanes maris TaxID=1734446 RepID=UPI002020B1C6|nr:GNAT family N-acetyltransferase [Actinoplanes maris]
MTSSGQTRWTELTGLPAELLALARRCLEADGGLPLAGEPGFLGRRWAGEDVSAFGLPADDGGGLLAAGAVRLTPSGPAFTGLVDPDARGLGLGADLLDYGLALASGDDGPPGAHTAGAHAVGAHAVGAHAAGVSLAGADTAGAPTAGAQSAGSGDGAGGVVTVESETLTDGAVALFASRGLRQVFAEDVMRIDLSGPMPAAAWPDGATVESWSGPAARRFHSTYQASFRDRPGFPAEPADDWIAENEDDDDFLPGCSLLVALPDVGDAGFITIARDWVVQVGVVPAARRRGLAAALITESLSRLRAVGGTQAWLTVNVNNPDAAALYRRLGFTDRGRRARFQP